MKKITDLVKNPSLLKIEELIKATKALLKIYELYDYLGKEEEIKALEDNLKVYKDYKKKNKKSSKIVLLM